MTKEKFIKNIPVFLKLFVPGYRKKWLERCSAIIFYINNIFPDMRFGEENGCPWIESKKTDMRVYGFWTEKDKLDIYKIIYPSLPKNLDKGYLRILMDYVTRYEYPHMRPDKKPLGYAYNNLFGFHGQHKDAIDDIKDTTLRNKLKNIFEPKDDDIIIDCGCYIGLGELSMAPILKNGHIYAVEADNLCYDKLNLNISHNNVMNVTTIHNAIWNKEQEMKLEYNYAQANSLIGDVVKGKLTKKIKTTTIDILVDKHNLKKLDMLSLTLNGAEVEALDGAKFTLSNLRPRIRLAGWYSRNGKKIWAITEKILLNYNYEVFVGEYGNVMALPQEFQTRNN